MDFLILQIFMGFMQGYESSKDKWYKLPLMGVLPQASFRLTTADRGWNPSNGSMPYTPPVTTTATTPCRGSSRAVWRCHDWVVSMCWFSVSCMLSPCTRRSLSCWVMAPKPRDEDVRLMRFGAPPELELVNRRPGACRVLSAGTVPWRTTGLMLMWVLWLLRRWCRFCFKVLPFVIKPGKPENLCLWPPSRGMRGMVSERQLFKWNSALGSGISFV